MKGNEKPIAFSGPPLEPSEAVRVGKGGRNGAEFLPTRRMPSDAQATLWLAEVESLQ